MKRPVSFAVSWEWPVINEVNMMQSKLNDWIDAYFDQMIDALQGLIRIDSSLDEERAAPGTPFGPGCRQALDYFFEHAQQLGFTCKNLDGYAGYAKFGPEAQGVVGILTHLDVVPAAPEGWRHPPFDAVIEGGKLYGRGSEDDKGPLMAALYAMWALKESGLPVNKEIRLIAGCDEETGSRCIKRYLAEEGQFDYGFSPDGLFPIYNAEKGIARVFFSKPFDTENSVIKQISGGTKVNMVPDAAKAMVDSDMLSQLEGSIARLGLGDDILLMETAEGVLVQAKGVTVHSMEPEKGKNALLLLLAVLAGLEKPGDEALQTVQYLSRICGLGSDGVAMGIAAMDEISGPLTMNLAVISVEDGRITVKIDVRYPVTHDWDTLLIQLQRAAAKGGFDFRLHQHKKPLYVPAHTPFIKALVQAYEETVGEQAELLSMGGGTYCRFVENTVSYGPVFPGHAFTAHQNNEFIKLEDLRLAAKVYAQALYLLAQ